MLAASPPAEPIFGHARTLASDPLRTLVRWMEDYGPIVRFRVGRRVAHVVYSPDAIRRVLSDPDGIYGKDTHGYRTLRLFVGDGLLTSEGTQWKNQRRALAPAFHRQSVAKQVRVMSEVATAWAAELARAKEPVAIDEITMRTTLEIVTRCLFGTDLKGDASEIAQAIGDLQVCANRRITAPFTLPFAIPTPEHLRIRRARARLRGLLERLVLARRKRGPSEEPDAIDLLLATNESDEVILDELVTLLVAGHESTANALTWALVLLASHPRELAVVREELDGKPQGATELPCLRAAIDETMRLYPPAWSFGRAPRRADVLAGCEIPAGGLVMIVPWATHRDRTIFPQPEAFDPRRFRDGSPPPFAFLPFGGGPRTCIGHAFARVEMQVVLATWLRVLDFELVAGQDLTPRPLITLRPRDGLRFRVRPREN